MYTYLQREFVRKRVTYLVIKIRSPTETSLAATCLPGIQRPLVHMLASRTACVSVLRSLVTCVHVFCVQNVCVCVCLNVCAHVPFTCCVRVH